jgi:hypothetical protein
MIEAEWRSHSVTEISFGRSKKHETVRWRLNGQEKFFPFPKTSPDQRSKLNIRSEVRRYCRFMKEGKAPTRH